MGGSLRKPNGGELGKGGAAASLKLVVRRNNCGGHWSSPNFRIGLEVGVFFGWGRGSDMCLNIQ